MQSAADYWIEYMAQLRLVVLKTFLATRANMPIAGFHSAKTQALLNLRHVVEALNRLIDYCERQFELPLLLSNS